MEDQELAKAAAAGDQRAFETLVNLHRGAIYNLAYRITLNEEDALDVMQEVFLRVSERIGSYRGQGSIRSWLLTITSREAANILRRSSRKETATEPEIVERLADDGWTPQPHTAPEDLERQERLELVHRAMHRLAPQQRAILTLRLQDVDLREIGEQLDIPYGQVRSQLSQAVSKLRSILGKENNNAG